MQLTQRNLTLALFALEIVTGLGGLIEALVNADTTASIVLIGTLPLLGGLAWLYWRGWRWAAAVNVLIIATVIAGVLVDTRQNTLAPIIFVPMALALVLTDSLFVLITAALVYLGALIKTGYYAPYLDATNILLYVLTAGSLFLGRRLFELSSAATFSTLATLQTERTNSERYAQELAAQTDVLRAQNQRQEQLLTLVAALETPTVQVAEGVLLAPIIGYLDPERAKTLTSRLLHSAADQRISTMILDISGLNQLDRAGAQQLLRLQQALQLLGTNVIISGIGPDVAAILVNEQVDLHAVATVPSPHIALAQLLAQAR